MCTYMYPIKIDREKQTTKYWENHILPDRLLKLSDILKLVGENDKFHLQAESEVFGAQITLCILKERLETNKEQSLRVKKETAYMAEYNKRHNI